MWGAASHSFFGGFWPCCAACGTLVPQPNHRLSPVPQQWKQSSKHWTAREFPEQPFLKLFFGTRVRWLLSGSGAIYSSIRTPLPFLFPWRKYNVNQDRPSIKKLNSHVVVQSLGHVWLFSTLWTAARQAPLSFIISWSLLKLMSTELVMPSDHFILSPPSPPAFNLSQHQG